MFVKTRRRLTDWDKHARDAGQAAYHHRPEEDPPSAPLVHDVPADEVRGNLHSRAREKNLS